MSMMTMEDLMVDNPALNMVLNLKEANHDKGEESGLDSETVDFAIGSQSSKDEYEAMAMHTDSYLHALSLLEEGLEEGFELDLPETKEKVAEQVASVGYIVKKYQSAVKIIDSEIHCLQDEIKVLQAKSQMFLSQISRTSEALISVMQKYQLEKIDTPFTSLKIQEAEPELIVNPDFDLNSLKNSPFVTVNLVINKEAIIHELENRKVIPGLSLSSGQLTLTIE